VLVLERSGALPRMGLMGLMGLMGRISLMSPIGPVRIRGRQVALPTAGSSQQRIEHDVERSLLFRERLFRRKGIHVESLRIETELVFDGLGLESEISQRIDVAAKFSLGVFH
jgi:hypothetical protein